MNPNYFTSDPFGIHHTSVSGGYMNKPKKKSSFWTFFGIFIFIVLVALIYFFRDLIFTFFKKTVFKLNQKLNPEPPIETTESSIITDENRLLPEPNIENRLDITDKANWDLTYINTKQQEGKAFYIKDKGWLIYA